MEEGSRGEEAANGGNDGLLDAWLARTAGLSHGAALRMQPSQPASKEGEYAVKTHLSRAWPAWAGWSLAARPTGGGAAPAMAEAEHL